MLVVGTAGFTTMTTGAAARVAGAGPLRKSNGTSSVCGLQATMLADATGQPGIGVSRAPGHRFCARIHAAAMATPSRHTAESRAKMDPMVLPVAVELPA